MQSESLSADESSSEERGPNQAAGGRSNSEKSILIDDQDCKSIDSHMSSLRMPKYLQNLEHMAQFKDVNETENPSYEGTGRTYKLSQSQKTIQRQPQEILANSALIASKVAFFNKKMML